MDTALAGGTYRILLSTLEALVAIQEQCIERPESDDDADQLFWEMQDVIQRITPIILRLRAGPELPPNVAAFLAQLEIEL